MLGFITNPLNALLGLVVGALVALFLTIASYEGFSLFGFPIIPGIVDARIEAYDKAETLKAMAKRREAEGVLGEREAARAESIRRRQERDAQQRVDLATGQATDKEAFLIQQAINNKRIIQALEAELVSRVSPQCKTKVIKQYEKINSCPYPGDTVPSASFLRQYQNSKP